MLEDMGKPIDRQKLAGKESLADRLAQKYAITKDVTAIRKTLAKCRKRTPETKTRIGRSAGVLQKQSISPRLSGTL